MSKTRSRPNRLGSATLVATSDMVHGRYASTVCCCRTACPNLICWYVVVELESLLVALDCYRILLATVPPVGYPHTRLAHLTPLYNRHSKLGCCKEDYSSIPTDPDYGLVVVHVHPWRAGAQLWRRQWPRRPARYAAGLVRHGRQPVEPILTK